ncbi:MAG: SpoIIE family protein phosphatase, partial [Bacteroidia bacterium]|nr:SpoIIE family protein phosphatase [Bacteroidia bacterium]
NNPLFIISSDPQGHINKSNRHSITSGTEQGDLAGRLIEIKGDNMPIGIYSKMDDFTNNIITVQKGDTLYLFSDGYIDQFGGEKGKKFSNRSRG